MGSKIGVLNFYCIQLYGGKELNEKIWENFFGRKNFRRTKLGTFDCSVILTKLRCTLLDRFIIGLFEPALRRACLGLQHV